MHVRTLLAVGLAALLAVPVAAHAQKKGAAQPRPASQQLSVGAWLGYEMGDFDGIALRVEGEMPYQKLSPQIALSFVGSVGFSHLTFSESFAGYDIDTSVNVLSVVPVARFTMPVSPGLSLFGDAGLGLYYASLSVDTNVPFAPDISDSDVGLMLRLGAGGLYQVNPRTKVGASVVLDPHFGDYDDATFSLLVGLTYQL